MLSGKDVPPEKTGKGRTECRAECSVVDTQSHTVDRGPERSVANGGSVAMVYLLPCLDYAGEEDRGTDIRSSELEAIH